MNEFRRKRAEWKRGHLHRAAPVRQSRFCQRCNAGRIGHDIRRNGRLRRGTVAVVVRLMGRAFLRPLSQPADYDASAGESRIPHTTCSGYRNAICPTNDSWTFQLPPQSALLLPRGSIPVINPRISESTVSRTVCVPSPSPRGA